MAWMISLMPASFDDRFGAKPPSSPTAVVSFFVLQDLLERMEDLRAVAQRFAERRRAHRDDHELLHVEELSACAPPLMTFIIGTGITARGPCAR